MNKEIYLPNYLKPFNDPELVRIGKNSDGGYLVNKVNAVEAKTLISLGIAFDWSFEEEFKSLNKKIYIHSFDGSMGFRYLKRNLKLRIKTFILRPNLQTLKKLYERLILALRFSIFFKFNFFPKKIFHTEKFVEMNESDFPNFQHRYGYKPQFIDFESLVNDLDSDLFLSIDIEGAEYKILDKIAKIQDKLLGIVIEFHDAHLNGKNIENFIEKINLKLVHTHINNFGPIVDGFPSVIELSFSKNGNDMQLVEKLPHSLDKENNKEGPKYLVSF